MSQPIWPHMFVYWLVCFKMRLCLSWTVGLVWPFCLCLLSCYDHNHAYYTQSPVRVLNTDPNPCKIVTQYTPVKNLVFLHCDIIDYRRKPTVASIWYIKGSCFPSYAWCVFVHMFMCVGICVHVCTWDGEQFRVLFFNHSRSYFLNLEEVTNETRAMEWCVPRILCSLPPSTRSTNTWLSIWVLKTRNAVKCTASILLSKIQHSFCFNLMFGKGSESHRKILNSSKNRFLGTRF